jgi:hypothetical protein
MSNSEKSNTVSLSASAIIGLPLVSLDGEGDSDIDSSLTTNDGEYLDSEVEYGAFRWSELAKFSDESPDAIFRKHSVDVVAATRNEKVDTAKPAEEIETNRQGDDKMARRTSTELGERISLLLNSPTNSPRSVMTGHRNGLVIGRKTLKKPRTSSETEAIVDIADDDIISLDNDETDYDLCVSMEQMRM